MSEYKILAGKRFKKQAAMTAVFLFILIGGRVFPAIGYLVPLCMLFGIGFGVVKGRKWCNYYCPRGSFFDAACKPVSPGRKIPPFLRKKSFRIAVLVLLMAMMGMQIFRRWPDFNGIGFFFVNLLTLVTAAGVVLALFFHQRTWCGFCPVGSLANWCGGNKSPLKIDSALCNECKLCARVCPMQIVPYKFKSEGIQVVADRDCLKCGLCVAACPQKALKG